MLDHRGQYRRGYIAGGVVAASARAAMTSGKSAEIAIPTSAPMESAAGPRTTTRKVIAVPPAGDRMEPVYDADHQIAHVGLVGE